MRFDELKNEIYFLRRKHPFDQKKFYELLEKLDRLKIKTITDRAFNLAKKEISNTFSYDDLKDKLLYLLSLQVLLIEDKKKNVKKQDIEKKKKEIDTNETLESGFTIKEHIQKHKTNIESIALAFLISKINDLNLSKKDFLRKYNFSKKVHYDYVTKLAREKIYQRLEIGKPNIKGWISIAVLDDRTSTICLTLSDRFYSKRVYQNRANVPNLPPRHPYCRSIMKTVYEGQNIKEFRKQTISEFLDNNPDDAVKILGKKKYELYKKTNIYNIIDFKKGELFTDAEIINKLKK